jgi:putative tryptophan/tyrosine transport system substrate-binding protein
MKCRRLIQQGFWMRFLYRRRDFVSLVAAASLASPFSARAQQPGKIPRIGIIDDSPIWNAFRQALRDLGRLEGENIAFEYRYAGGLPDRLAWVAAELVRRPVDLIATFGTPATRAAKEATKSIPIVMMNIGDPVGPGLSRASPGQAATSPATPRLAPT